MTPKAFINYVLIEVDDSNEFVKIGEAEIKVDTSYEPERRAQQFGKVIHVGDLFYSEDKLSQLSLAYNVPCEIVEGDTVMFHFLCVQSAIAAKRCIHISPTVKQIFIRYDELYLRVRGEEVYPLNGYIFIAPADEVVSTALIIPDIAKKKSKTRGIVKYAGCMVNGYHNIEEYIADCSEIKVGDDVAFSENDAVPLTDNYKPMFGLLYKMHRIDVMGTYLEKEYAKLQNAMDWKAPEGNEFIHQEDETVFDA